MKRFYRIGIAILLLLILSGGIYFFYMYSSVKTGADTFVDEYGLSFMDYQGQTIKLSSFKNKIIVAHAWASWCVYCGDELKNLARIKDVYGDSIVVIGINRAEPTAVAKNFTDSLEIPSSIILLLDPDDTFFRHIDGYAMPETVFTNEKGDILFHKRGPLSFEEAIQQINAITKPE